jgi:hypothetical protein
MGIDYIYRESNHIRFILESAFLTFTFLFIFNAGIKFVEEWVVMEYHILFSEY